MDIFIELSLPTKRRTLRSIYLARYFSIPSERLTFRACATQDCYAVFLACHSARLFYCAHPGLDQITSEHGGFYRRRIQLPPKTGLADRATKRSEMERIH